MNKIGSAASEEKLFESVNRRLTGRTYILTDAYLCVYFRTKLPSLCVENWTHNGTLYVIFDTQISRLVCLRITQVYIRPYGWTDGWTGGQNVITLAHPEPTSCEQKQDSGCGGFLRFPTGTILAICDLQVICCYGLSFNSNRPMVQEDKEKIDF